MFVLFWNSPKVQARFQFACKALSCTKAMTARPILSHCSLMIMFSLQQKIKKNINFWWFLIEKLISLFSFSIRWSFSRDFLHKTRLYLCNNFFFLKMKNVSKSLIAHDQSSSRHTPPPLPWGVTPLISNYWLNRQLICE